MRKLTIRYEYPERSTITVILIGGIVGLVAFASLILNCYFRKRKG